MRSLLFVDVPGLAKALGTMHTQNIMFKKCPYHKTMT